MPKIGLRNIKTAIAIFICAMIYVVLLLINEDFAKGWYTPFFAGLGTAYSIYPDKKSSIRQAKNRILASIFGGFYALFLIFIYENAMNLINPNISEILDLFIRYSIVSIGAIGVVYVTLVFKQPATTFVAILTYLSVTINARNGIPNWQFGLNRIISTIVGVTVALGVNLFHIPRFKNKEALFVVCLDGLYPSDMDNVEGYVKYKLNSIIHSNANVTLFTTRTPTTLKPLLEQIHFNLPLICMNGAGLYDIQSKKYLHYENIDSDTSKQFRTFLNEKGITPFINIVDDDLLHIFNASLDNDGEKAYASVRKNSSYCSYLTMRPRQDVEVTYFVIVEKREVIDQILDEVKTFDYYDKLYFTVYEKAILENYVYLKVYSSKIKEMQALNILLQEKQYKKVVSLVCGEYDELIMSKTNWSITNLKGSQNIKDKASVVLNSFEAEKLFKEANRVFHSKKFK